MPYSELQLDNQLCFRLYTVSRLVIQAYRPYLDKLGITYPQYLVMMILWEKDNILVGDIASKLVLDTNTVTPLLQRMEKLGIIERKKGKEDSRQKVVRLTEKGKQMEEQAREVPNCLARYICQSGVSGEEMQAIIPTIDKMIQLFKHK